MEDKTQTNKSRKEAGELISCLTNEIVVVRRLPKQSGMFNNPKHVFSGGMAETASRTFTVPILESNGAYINVLTNDEKEFLETFMGLEFNALSIYKAEDNFWDNFTVRLTKGDTYLDLSNPHDYIKYKVLLANKELIAESLQVLETTPRATYQYVIIRKVEEAKNSSLKVSNSMEAYMKFGQIQEDIHTMRVIVEIITGKPTSPKATIEVLKNEINNLIIGNAKLFLDIASDPYLQTKVLIKRSLEVGTVFKKGDYLYLKQDNSPLCEVNEEPTMALAAKYLNSPKHQEVKLTLEAKLNS